MIKMTHRHELNLWRSVYIMVMDRNEKGHLQYAFIKGCCKKWTSRALECRASSSAKTQIASRIHRHSSQELSYNIRTACFCFCRRSSRASVCLVPSHS